jgi:AraC family ethanolamine operon transcriptional activator
VWTSSTAELQGIDLQMGWLGSGNLAHAGMHEDFYLCYLPTTPGIEYRASGVVLKKNTFAIIKPGSEFCMATKDPHNWCAAFVSKKLCGELPVHDQSNSGSSTCWVSRPTRDAASRFRTLVSQVMRSAAGYSDFESTAAARVAARDLMGIIKSVCEQPVVNRNNRDGRPKVPRERIIPTCMDFIEQRTDTHIEVSELARTADVSERTLRSAFNEYFGVGPTHYLRLRRLNLIHRALRAAEPDGATVIRILAEYGEWDIGRFASHYRQHFGELPSETLRKKTK